MKDMRFRSHLSFLMGEKSCRKKGCRISVPSDRSEDRGNHERMSRTERTAIEWAEPLTMIFASVDGLAYSRSCSASLHTARSHSSSVRVWVSPPPMICSAASEIRPL